jgi:hypothetical protein
MESAVEIVLLMLVVGAIIAAGRYFGGIEAVRLTIEQLQEDWMKQGAHVQFEPVRADRAAQFQHRQPEAGAVGIANDQIVFRSPHKTYVIPFTSVRFVSLRDVEYRTLRGEIVTVKDVVGIHQDESELVEHTFALKEDSRRFAEKAAALCRVELRQEPLFKSL